MALVTTSSAAILRAARDRIPRRSVRSGPIWIRAICKGIAVVTKSKDLRTGRSVWQQHRAPPVPHRPLTRDLETDVLVIGAGITGAMVADALCRQRHERRGGGPPRPGQGLDHGQHRPGAIRNRHAADPIVAQDRQARCCARLAALAARGRCAGGAAWRARRARRGDPRHALPRGRCARSRRADARASRAARRWPAEPLSRPRELARALWHRAIGGAARLRQSRHRSAQARRSPCSRPPRRTARKSSPRSISSNVDPRRSGVIATAASGQTHPHAAIVVFATGYELPKAMRAARDTRSFRPGRSRRCGNRAICGRSNA